MAKAKRTPEGYARHVARTREYKRQKRLKDPEYREKRRLEALAYYYKNKERILTDIIINGSEKRKRYNEARRLKRRKNPDLAKANDLKSRQSSIKSYISRFSRGLITADELDRRLRQSLIRADERCKLADSVRRRLSESGSAERESGGGLCETDPRPDKTKT